MADISGSLFIGSGFDYDLGLERVYGALWIDDALIIASSSLYLLGTSSLLPPSQSTPGEIVNVVNNTGTGSLYYNDGVDYVKVNTNTNFNYSFTTDPTDIIFATFPTGSTNERAFTFKYVLTSGNAINAGQGQVIGDGSTIAIINIFNSSSAFGAPSPTFAANYIGAGIAVSASFTGENYTISGSYSSMV